MSGDKREEKPLSQAAGDRLTIGMVLFAVLIVVAAWRFISWVLAVATTVGLAVMVGVLLYVVFRSARGSESSDTPT